MSALNKSAIGHGSSNVIAALCVALLCATPAFADTQVDWTKYAHSFTVKFSGYSGTTTLTDFPILVRISESRIAFPIYAKCKVPDGGDLRFSDASGALLSSEIECWNPGGESLVWVKVPSLNADTVITGHFGCSSPDEVTPSDVWSNGFLGVWHLGAEGSNDQPDSVAGGNPFVLNTTYPDGVCAGTNGIAGLAAAFNQRSDGKGAYSISDSSGKYSGFSKLTVEYWTYQDDHDVGKTINTNDLRVLYKHNAWSAYEAKANGKMGFSLRLTSATGSDKYVNPNNDVTKPARTNWNHTATIFDGTYSGESGNNSDTRYNRKVYLNGNSLATATTDLSGTMVSNDQTLYLGNKSGSLPDSYRGIIDEVRLSTVTRSADWVKATYDSIANDQFAVYEGTQLDWTVYDKKFSMTFDGVMEGATLNDFPVLVRISEYDEATGKGIRNFSYGDCLLPNGGDLRFFDASGTLLPSEVERWDTEGESLVWVKVPTLAKGTKIWACYGSVYAHAVTPSDVWSNGFFGVWHLGAAEGASVQTDSVAGGTSFELHPSYPDGVRAGTNGVAGLAAAFHQRDDGYGAYRIADTSKKYCGFNKLTVEYWTYQDDHDVGKTINTNDLRVLYKANAWSAYEAKANGKMGFAIRLTSDTSNDKFVNPENSAAKPPRAAWNHTATVFDGTDEGTSGGDTTHNREVYLNGNQLLTPDADLPGTMIQNTSTLYLGNKAGSSPDSYRGIIDEVRISTVTRSAAWVKATYDTIANNATFTTYGVVKNNNIRGYLMIVR